MTGALVLADVLAHTDEDVGWTHITVELLVWTGGVLVVAMALLLPFWVRARLRDRNRS